MKSTKEFSVDTSESETVIDKKIGTLKLMYNKRTWLNIENSDSTSSIVAFDGDVTYKNEPIESRFLEITDCQTKIRLHQTTDDTKENFIAKMKLLKSEIEQFINHLENN